MKNGDGAVVACNSACEALNQDQYCCRGDYGTPDKCPPTKYSKIFKQACPRAYRYICVFFVCSVCVCGVWVRIVWCMCVVCVGMYCVGVCGCGVCVCCGVMWCVCKQVAILCYFSYAYDDHTSTFTCRSADGAKSGYVVTFCPESE